MLSLVSFLLFYPLFVYLWIQGSLSMRYSMNKSWWISWFSTWAKAHSLITPLHNPCISRYSHGEYRRSSSSSYSSSTFCLRRKPAIPLGALACHFWVVQNLWVCELRIYPRESLIPIRNTSAALPHRHHSQSLSSPQTYLPVLSPSLFEVSRAIYLSWPPKGAFLMAVETAMYGMEAIVMLF